MRARRLVAASAARLDALGASIATMRDASALPHVLLQCFSLHVDSLRVSRQLTPDEAGVSCSAMCRLSTWRLKNCGSTYGTALASRMFASNALSASRRAAEYPTCRLRRRLRGAARVAGS